MGGELSYPLGGLCSQGDAILVAASPTVGGSGDGGGSDFGAKESLHRRAAVASFAFQIHAPVLVLRCVEAGQRGLRRHWRRSDLVDDLRLWRRRRRTATTMVMVMMTVTVAMMSMAMSMFFIAFRAVVFVVVPTESARSPHAAGEWRAATAVNA